MYCDYGCGNIKRKFNQFLNTFGRSFVITFQEHFKALP